MYYYTVMAFSYNQINPRLTKEYTDIGKVQIMYSLNVIFYLVKVCNLFYYKSYYPFITCLLALSSASGMTDHTPTDRTPWS